VTLHEYAERHALADLLLELGPDAPTLCAGWTTQDLAMHVTLIQRRVDSWVGGLLVTRVPATRGYFDKLVARERSRPWPEMVDRVRSLPAHGPFAHQRLRERIFLRESVVHHEDVRRANGLGPRSGSTALQDAVWPILPGFARLLDVPDRVGLELTRPDGRSHLVGRGDATARLVGEPIEMLLYLFGRTAVADVQLTGASSGVRVKDSSKLVSLPVVAAA
jgi:uncharacterized protein (TIGR03085 family)